MLNVDLINRFQDIHARAATGCLVVDFARRRVSFFFKNGELHLLDFCEEKEALLIRQYRRYHKIGPEIEALVTQMQQSQGASVHDFLGNQQLVTPSEMEQITRTLVEDCLCDVFGTAATDIHFESSIAERDIDLERTAVKLRIQVELLLEMVQARVAERDAVRDEISDYGMIYGLAEGAPDPDGLNDMERNVLHFVDGRRSVEELASAVRDSSLNTACYLVSLANQGFVAKVEQSTRLRLASASPEKAYMGAVNPGVDATAAVQEAPSAVMRRETEFAPVYAAPRPASKAPMIVLAVILLVVAGLAGLLFLSREQRSEYQEKIQELRQAVAAEQWIEADRQATTTAEVAAFDPKLQANFEVYLQEIDQDLRNRVQQLRQSLIEHDYAAVGNGLERLPPRALSGQVLIRSKTRAAIADLDSDLEAARLAAEKRAGELATQVGAALTADNLQQALRLLESEPSVIGERARSELAAWRNRRIDEAGTPSMPLVERQQLLDRVKEASPSDSDQATIRRLESEIGKARQRLQERYDHLSASIAAGAFRDLEAELQSLQRQATGGQLAEDFRRLSEVVQQHAARVDRLLSEGVAAAKHGRDQDSIRTVRQRIEQELQQYPQHGMAEVLRALDKSLAVLQQALARNSIAGELEMLNAAITGGSIAEQFAPLFSERITALAAEEERFVRDLQDIVARQNQIGIEEAQQQLQEFLARTDVARGRVLPQAQEVMRKWQEEMEKRRETRDALTAAMLADQAEEVDRLAKILNLPRLPLAVATEPPGATVRKAGQILGTTPMVIDDISPQRVSDVYQVQLDGYQPHEFNATDARGGWKLAAELQRMAAIQVLVDGPITSRPSLIDGQVWLAGTSNVASVGLAAGKVEQYPFADGIVQLPLRNPVYAPVIYQDGQYLVTTRDEVLIRLRAGKLTREPVSGASDYALLRFVNPNVLDREMILLAGRDGQLHASDPSQARRIWSSGGGVTFMISPHRIGELVYSLRQNGTVEINQIDDGLSVGESRIIDDRVLAAWWDGDILHGISGTSAWAWDPQNPKLIRSELPNQAILADRDVFVAFDWRVFIRDDEEVWKPVGKLRRDDRRLSAVVRWRDHAAVVQGQQLYVLGPRSFSYRTDKDFLRPLVAGENLVVVETGGQVTVFKP